MTPAVHQSSDPPLKTVMDGYMTPSSIAVLLGLVVSVLTILRAFRTMRRENEQDARERADEIKDQIREMQISLGERVKALETSSVDFMPRREIEGKIDHLKINRQQAEAALDRRLIDAEKDVRNLMVEMGAIKQQQGSTAAEMAEIKALLKEQSRDLKEIAAQMRAH